MNVNGKELADMTDVELRALGFDVLTSIDKHRELLAAVRAEIERREAGKQP